MNVMRCFSVLRNGAAFSRIAEGSTVTLVQRTDLSVEGAVRVEASCAPLRHTDNIAKFVEVAKAVNMRWGYGDFELDIDIKPRSHLGDQAGEGGHALEGKTPANVFWESFTTFQRLGVGEDDISIRAPAHADADALWSFAADLVAERPAEHDDIYKGIASLAELAEIYGSVLLVAALLPEAHMPIIQTYEDVYRDGNEANAHFATAGYDFRFSYDTS
eukprot:gb/GFBE01035856.1/.p1 GENE.gb/GFBE01035856.1/~~gb/GFBE01035856.1/.p1  ORF type:complete len:217 (+),score=20.86 gb/GFBE01035856.1/:1-651(+)